MTKRTRSTEQRRQRDARSAARVRPADPDAERSRLLRKLLEAGRTKAQYLRARGAQHKAPKD